MVHYSIGIEKNYLLRNTNKRIRIEESKHMLTYPNLPMQYRVKLEML